MKCEHVDYDEYFEKCPDCGADYETVLTEEIENCKTKEHARELALDWQTWQAEQKMYWGEVSEWREKFYQLGKRVKLVKEFRENGII